MTKVQNLFTSLGSYLKLFFELTVLILGYLFFRLFKIIFKFLPSKVTQKFAGVAQTRYQHIVNKLDKPKNHSISRLNLIEISVQNLFSKKSRTLITIGGMAVGIGAIVFLVSIGYGLQELVISRVARLEELKQTDVIAQPNSELKINDEVLSDFHDLTETEQILPLISVVGRITYKEAVADMAVYGVTSQYLEKSAIQPLKGQIFASEDLAKTIFEKNGISEAQVVDHNQESQENKQGEVAGVNITQVEYLASLGKIKIKMEPDVWYRVRSQPDTASSVLGYTKRPEGQLQGEEVWGSSFIDNAQGSAGETKDGETLGKWVEAKVLLWEKDDDGQYQPILGDQEEQLQKTGFMAKINLETEFTEKFVQGEVLGDSTSSAETSSTTSTSTDDTSGINWVEIASESGQVSEQEITEISLGSKAQRQAVVNQAVLNVLGIEENRAIGEKFQASFVVMGKELGQPGEKIASAATDYEIVGVIPGNEVPLFYVPFLDLRSLGIVNYSQVKIVTNDQPSLPEARQKIEAMGFVTRSVVDTVDQIQSIFATTRLVLGLLGFAALLVASLGMFNTLTVSLLERTREVGLMKALGMKSSEVKELFLIESLIMGLLGGMLGLLGGFLAGKILSLVLSVFSVARGVGVMNISVIPLGFVLVIVFLAILVGIITGLYPAKRAREISALNALRYE